MPQPDFQLIYTGTDITADIREFTIGVSATDNLEGKSDECSITLENTDLRWLATWLPGEGDRISLALGYVDALGLSIEYEIDEVTYEGVPDTIALKGISTPLTKALRQKNAVAYENVTLQEIAQQIAEKHSLTVVGELPDITFNRITQKHEPDLSFLRRIALDYGVVFKIESLTKLVFFRLSDVEAADPQITINRTDLTRRYQIKRKAAGTYKQANVSYQDPETGDFIDVTIDLEGNEVPKPADNEEGLIASEDELRISERVESLSIARQRAVEALKRANQSRLSLSTSLPGSIGLVAGLTFQLSGFMRADGKYLIEKATHSFSRSSGFITQIDSYKIN